MLCVSYNEIFCCYISDIHGVMAFVLINTTSFFQQKKIFHIYFELEYTPVTMTDDNFY